ncbi:MAG: hypothetical protein HY321_17420 [Armatimonadetes bacterium]|nr:hypothetical protein [Armatimonadota bacterium]
MMGRMVLQWASKACVELVGLFLVLALLAGLAGAAEAARAGENALAPEVIYPGERLHSPAVVPVEKGFRHFGYFRKSFQLANAADVWQAIVSIGQGAVALYVNGNEIPFNHPFFYTIQPVDLKPYLRDGKNVIAIYGERIAAERENAYDPYIYLDGQIVLNSGDCLPLVTDGTWKCSGQEDPGWNTTQFQDAAWRAPEIGPPTYDYMKTRPRGYTGRLVVESGGRSQLYFRDTEPLRFTVRIPRGLAAPGVRLKWALSLVKDNQGASQKVGSGEVTRGRSAGSSFAYALNAGGRPRGVYTLTTELVGRGGAIEAHPDEPLIVTGRVPQKEVAGASYTEGMTLTLEDTIDFTNPADPHPWVEAALERDSRIPAHAVTTPRIVKEGGLVYREAGARRGDMFSYRFRFEHPGSWYLVELDYPDNADRGIAVSLQKPCKDIYSGSQAAPSVETGAKFPTSGMMRTLRWIHMGTADDMAVDVVSQKQGCRAAAARIRFYRIEGNLPALKVAASRGRYLGLFAERGGLFARNFGGWYFPDVFNRARWDLTADQAFIRQLKTMFDASEAYVQYLRFTGQNFHMLAAIQYDERNTGFVPRPQVPGTRLNEDIRDVFLRVARDNDIRVMSSVTLSGTYALAEESVSDEAVAAGADTVRFVTRDGKQVMGRTLNGFHPRVEAAFFDLLEKIARNCAECPNWVGMNFIAYPGFSAPCFPADPPNVRDLIYGYEDNTTARFEKDTGVNVPGDPRDPARFRKRYDFLTAPDMRERWVAWRNQEVRRFMLAARDRLRRLRPDAVVNYTAYVDVRYLNVWARTNQPYGEWLRELMLDPAVVSGDDGVSVSRCLHATLRYQPMMVKEGWAPGWAQSVEPQAAEAYVPQTNRIAMVMHHFDEVEYRAPGIAFPQYAKPSGEIDWPWRASLGPFYTQAPDEYAREPFVQALITGDPETTFFGWCDSTILVGNEQTLRDFARAYTALPSAPFQPVLNTGLETDLAIRAASVGDDSYFYVANPGWWPVKGSVLLFGARAITDLATGKVVEGQVGAEGLLLPVSLPPYGVAAFRSAGKSLRILSYRTEPNAAAAKYLGKVAVSGLILSGQPAVANVVSADEMAAGKARLGKVHDGVREGRLAAAWSTLSDWRAWEFWHDRLHSDSGRRLWMTVGPFPGARDASALTASTPVEQDALGGALDFTKTYQGLNARGGQAEVKWRPLVSTARGDDPDYVDFLNRLSPGEWCVAYAFTRVHSPAERDATLAVGSDDGVRVWVNGALVHDNYVARAPEPQRDRIPVHLKAGWNTLLVKVEQQIGGWGFFLDLLDAEGKPLPEITFSVADPGKPSP